jgi:hypothetical protein
MWYDITTFVCSSKEVVIQSVMKYLKDEYNFDPEDKSNHDKWEFIARDLNPKTISDVTELFYDIVVNISPASDWRIAIYKREINGYIKGEENKDDDDECDE